MADVVDILRCPASTTFVEQLEVALELARAGNVSGYAMVYMHSNGKCCSTFDCGASKRGVSYFELVGAVACLKDDLLTRWRDV